VIVAARTWYLVGMRAYGKRRNEQANRNRPGTSRECTCCIPRQAHNNRDHIAPRERQAARKVIREEVLP